MSTLLARLIGSLSVLFLIIVYPAQAIEQSICTTLEDKSDKTVCEETTASRSWLTSVQIIAAGSVVPDLSASSGILYIFDSKETDGTQAVYNLPAEVDVKGDSAVVGNGGRHIKPRLLLDTTNKISRVKTSESGRYLFADVEIRTQTSNPYYQGLLQSDGAKHMELSGVTLSVDYRIPDDKGQTNVFYMLNLNGDSLEGNSTAVFDIYDCDILMPDISSTSQRFSLIAAYFRTSSVPKSDDFRGRKAKVRLRYSNNRIVTQTYRFVKKRVHALAITGSVDLDIDSNCNSIVNASGKDLLGKEANDLLFADVIHTTKKGAIGFNNYAWGWTLDNDNSQAVYDTLYNWQKLGVDTACNDNDLPLFIKALELVLVTILITILLY